VFGRQRKSTLAGTMVWPLQNSVFDYGTAVSEAWRWALNQTPEDVWNSQPYVRTVVTFLARNVAQLGLHCFVRVGDTERQRVSDDPLATTLRRPNGYTTSYELIFGLVADRALYDRAYWYIGSEQGQTTLTRIPPSRVVTHIARDPLGQVDAFRIVGPRGETPIDVPADRVLYFPGWNPTSSVGMPSSPIDAIRSVIAEQAAAFEFRKLAWANGAQTSQVMARPAGVPWKEGARDRFIADMRAQFGGDGPRRNGPILLEDGMTLTGQQFNAREAQWIDAAKLSLALVASVYHVNPTMVGLLDNANYSNVREFRKMLYGDTLGPILASIEDRINTFLVPKIASSAEEYVEFNIAEKLQGSFEEQSAALQSAVGGPWMLRSEARAVLNLPPIDGADELIVPMNVTEGGQPAPNAPIEQASRRLATVVPIKIAAADSQRQRINVSVSRYFDRQSRSVLSRIGSVDDWWQQQRWDDELTQTLHPLHRQIATQIGRAEAYRLGYSPDEYDAALADGYLYASASSSAHDINATTKSQLDEQIGTKDGDPVHVFDIARASRAAGIAVGMSTFLAGFASREAAQQIASRHDVEPTKTWVTGPNARASHSRMNGETVPIDAAFSNGMQWPAEGSDADEIAGCNCSIQINLA
jgi:HK97 family phage portal protein